MTIRRKITIAIAVSLLTATAWAQTSPPLNLKLPANSVAPASSSTAAKPAAGAAVSSTATASATGQSKPASASTAPGVYYGDTSGNRETDVTPATTDASNCDDYQYSQPQVHGDVGVGVVSGNRFGSGSYTSGDVNVTKNLGSCDHPGGSVGISIGVGQFNGFGGRGL